MLKELYIENLAVIKSAVIPISEKFNAFTGETGAGKSILINGINAVLGQRVTKDIVRTGSEKAVVTGLFTDLSEKVKSKLDELGIDCSDNEITVTREINADGGSVARINGRTSAVSVLREIGEMLINIHGQHDNQILMCPENHTQIIDSFGGDMSFLEEYRESFKELQACAKKYSEVMKKRNAASERKIYLSSVVEDIKHLELEKDEDLSLEEEYNMLKNSSDIINALNTSKNRIEGEDSGITDELSEIEIELGSVSAIYPPASAFLDRIASLKIDLRDLASEISHCSGTLEVDDEIFDHITERRNTINMLKRKYGLELNDLIELCEKSEAELDTIENSDELLDKFEKQKKELLDITTKKAKVLYEYRLKTSEKFVSRVTEELRFLDMPNVVIEIKHEKGKLSVNGMDTAEILISANKGEEPKPVSKIASGGELSRIMLALKTVIADKDDIPTLIFDEIDTGVSGRAAQKIGIKLQEISSYRQVLCVTHLAQIASMADDQLLIEKKTIGERTETNVHKLDEEGRIREIARIMGGAQPSELMLQNAKEQLILNKRK